MNFFQKSSESIHKGFWELDMRKRRGKQYRIGIIFKHEGKKGFGLHKGGSSIATLAIIKIQLLL